MPESEYVPVGPYFIRSGKRIGKSLEELMFENFSWLCDELKRMDLNLREGSKLNSMHEHLLWLLERGETRTSELKCPYCGEKKIKYFSYSYEEKKYFTSCDDLCRCNLFSKARQKYLLRFSSIKSFSLSLQPYVGDFLKKEFFPEQQDNLNAEKLFKFFAAQSPAY